MASVLTLCAPVHSDGITADQLAWLHDSADNDLESYPGPGWDFHELAIEELARQESIEFYDDSYDLGHGGFGHDATEGGY